jgi:O-antigen/teichoic acid export membrane protein
VQRFRAVFRNVSTDPPPASLKDEAIRRVVLANTAGNVARRVAALVTWFFLTPFVLHRLGAVQFGLWVLAGALLAYGKALDLGISGAVTKYVAEFRARGEFDEARTLVATALWIYCGLGVVAVALGSLLAPILPALLNLPPAERETASWLVFLSAVVVGIQLPSGTTYAVLRGLQRFDLLGLIDITATLVGAAATVVVLLLGGGLLGIVAVYGPLSIIMQVPALALIRREAPELGFGFRGARRNVIRRVAGFSSALFVIGFAERAKARTNEFIIGMFLPVAKIAPYAIARQFSELPRLFSEQFTIVLLPLASQLDAESDHARMRAIYIASARISLATFLALGCSALALAHPFLVLWVGAAYARDDLVAILLGAGLVSASLWPASSILQGMARHRPLALISLGSAVASIALAIILVHPLGLAGVALATLITTSAEAAFFVFPYAMRVIGVPRRTVLTEILLPAVVPAIPALTALYSLRAVADPTSLGPIVLIALIGVGVYVAVYLLVGAGPSERYLARRIGVTALRAARTATARAAGVAARR